MDNLIKFALVGGDMRQARLAAMLASDGHTVYVSCMEKAGEISKTQNLSTEEAFKRADCIILPLPAFDSLGGLNTPLSSKKISEDELLKLIPKNVKVFGGRFDEKFISRCRDMGIDIHDYFAREELKVANAAATAEGAIQIAMEETARTLCGAKALVIGYGRIGKLLSHKLWLLGADVVASARKPEDLAWIKAWGLKSVHTSNLEEILAQQDIIFNTVPSKVLGKYGLSLLKKTCLCVDLASKPGGIDFKAASELGVNVIWALSLPGEVAPESSGGAIKDTIYNLLEETEEF